MDKYGRNNLRETSFAVSSLQARCEICKTDALVPGRHEKERRLRHKVEYPEIVAKRAQNEACHASIAV